MDYGVVYKITNLVDGKIYIGQTTRTRVSAILCKLTFTWLADAIEHRTYTKLFTLSLKNYSQAISDYSQAIKFYPNRAILYYFRGLCHQILNRPTWAEDDFAKARELGYNPQ